MLLTYFVNIQRRPSVTWLLCQKQLWLHACQTIMHNIQLFSLQDSLKPARVKHFGYALNSWSSWNLQKPVWCDVRRRQLHVSRGKALSRIKPLSFKSFNHIARFNLFVQKWFPELSDKKNEQVIREVSLRTMSFENVMMIVERKKKHSW